MLLPCVQEALWADRVSRDGRGSPAGREAKVEMGRVGSASCEVRNKQWWRQTSGKGGKVVHSRHKYLCVQSSS